MSEALLRGESLRRVYHGRSVVDGVTLAVRPGEVLAVLGPNGAGKSTLFRLLLLLERADEGRILLGRREVRPGDREAARRLAGVFQRPFLFSGSVRDNVAYGLRVRRLPLREREARVEEVLTLLGLERLAGAPVQTLSGGEAQRVALARAIAPRPDVLLLDEPTANLDVTVKRRFREDLERLVRTQTGGALLITHDPADAFALADTIAVMEGGRIVQVGPPETLVLEPSTPFVAAFTGAELLLDGIVRGEEDGLLVVETGGVRLLVARGNGAIGPGTPVHVAYRPEDVLLTPADAREATRAPTNRVRLRVAALTPVGGMIRVRLEGPPDLVALLTRPAALALGLAPGAVVTARLEVMALRAFPAPSTRTGGGPAVIAEAAGSITATTSTLSS